MQIDSCGQNELEPHLGDERYATCHQQHTDHLENAPNAIAATDPRARRIERKLSGVGRAYCSSLMFAALMTFAHFTRSARMSAPSCSGVEGHGAMPCLAM